MEDGYKDHDGAQGSLFGPGIQLREARIRAGMTLDQVAARTRISQRHLELIEAGGFSRLPGRPYAVGFSRTYAGLVGLDAADIARQVRALLDSADGDGHRRSASAFEPGDPARIPSARLGWLTALAALLLAAGTYAFYSEYFRPGGELPALREPAKPRLAPKPAGPAAGAASGPVVFTALEEGIWAKFYDGQGRQLMQKQMARGESYTVPPDADGPQLWTGRPDALAITVGGMPLPKLAEREQVMKDVLVTAEALRTRKAEPADSAADAGPSGASPTG